MRLTYFEQNIIRKTFTEIFESGDVYLFGSRVDNSKKGGDIDLYLVPDKKFEDESDKKIQFLIKLDKYLGEQKIDVVLAKDKNRAIEKEALKKGINLMDTKKLRIEKYINECNKHQIRIVEAYEEVKGIFPLSGKRYSTLSNMEVKNIDQYLFRFTKMQDTIGEKIFRLIAEDFVEDINKLTFIDTLNQLEKVRILDSVEDWKNLRKIRNNIAHQYDDEVDEMADAINKIVAQKDILIDIFNKIKNYYAI